MGMAKTPGNRARTAEREARRKMTPKQIRARARRRSDTPGEMGTLTAREQTALLGKPMEEWDLEELARGRPRDKNGNFTGVAPKWVTRAMHEKSIELFKEMMRTDMRSHTVRAMEVLRELLDNEDIDDKGKPIVAPGVKADTAKFLLEHLLGKPTQPIEADISIKLQGILGSVLVQPDAVTGGFMPASSHRVLEGEIVETEEDEDE